MPALLAVCLQSHTLEFDVVGHPRANFCFSVTFPFHPYKDGRKGGEVRGTALRLVDRGGCQHFLTPVTACLNPLL